MANFVTNRVLGEVEADLFNVISKLQHEIGAGDLTQEDNCKLASAILSIKEAKRLINQV